MRRFRNLSIGGKITTSVAIVIVLEVLIAVVGLYYVRDLRGEIDTLVDVGAERIKLAARLNRNFYQLATLTGELLVATSSSRRSVVTKAIAARKAEAYGRIEQLRKIAATSDLETLASFGVIFRDYLSLVEQIRGLMEQGRSLDAARLADTRASRLIALGTELLERLVDRQDRGLDDAKRASARRADIGTTVIVVLMALSTLLGLGFGVIVARMIAGDLNRLVGVANNIASGNLDNPIVIDGADETGQLASAVDTMQRSLRQAREESEAKIWLENGLGRLNAVVRGEQAIETIATNVIREIAETLDAKIGAFYAMAEHGGERELRLLGSYAYTRRKNLSSRFAIGEGLVGQAALERQPIVIRNAPEDYLTIASGLGEGRPHFICVTPFEHDDDVKGVIEVGSFGELGEKQTDYLERAMPIIAVTLQSALGRQALAQSLERAQQLTEELQVQQEELRASNEELEEQTMALRQSEERLKAQQEELEVMNVELEEKNELLERQKRAVEVARSDISAKAEQLAQASKYKSEFLANMSHELRTPLNSLLILSRVFADNREGNLTDDQVESARVIYNSGTDLLGLINDILDLAKIEAGRMDLQLGRVALRDLSSTILDSFQHIAEEKGIELRVEIGAGAPGELVTDRKRLHQVLKNLISNAIKFTEVGGATVTFGPVPADRTLTRSDLARSEALAIAVRDTGIGIPHDKQQLIFEAFQQVEGGTTRKYGGTGLGLSITREIVQLLGGEIHVESEPGQGTTFLVVLPTQLQTTEVQPTRQSGSSRLGGSPDSGAAGRSTQVREIARVPDDRGNLADDETAILIIDDDPTFAALLARKCHEQGFKTLVAHSGEDGIKLADVHSPRAVILDLKLPGMDGWAVLEMLKDNPRTRHLPVHIMSVEEADLTARRKGAIGFLHKPADRDELDDAFRRITETFSKSIKTVLVVEDDSALRGGIVELISDRDVRADEAATGAEALRLLAENVYDCVVLDLGLPDMDGTELLRALESKRDVAIPPVIVYTGRALDHDEELELRNFSDSIIIKDVRSEERLMDEVSLFLHSVVSQMPERKRKMITDLHDVDRLLNGKQVLIVDDDMRTVFALSRILSGKGVKTHKAENGERALAVLDQNPAIEMVLMDIMMPVMDGYETMRRIRKQERFRALPIIALTAKAMKGDQERCIEAGANDYLPKPVDETRLYSMMRVWLYR